MPGSSPEDQETQQGLTAPPACSADAKTSPAKSLRRRPGGLAPQKCPPDLIAAADLDAYLAATERPVLVHAAAPWSAPSRAMGPQFAKAAANLQRKVRSVTLEIHDAPAAAQLGISAVPALVLFHGGRAVGHWMGALNAKRIVAWTRQTLAAADLAAG